MGKLTVLMRESVRFNPKDPLHRQYYYQYIRTNKLGDCPVRFTTVQDDQGNMVEKVRRMLCDYYTDLEFVRFSENASPNANYEPGSLTGDQLEQIKRILGKQSSEPESKGRTADSITELPLLTDVLDNFVSNKDFFGETDR